MNDAVWTGWRKSRRSTSSGNCVEAGAAPTRHVVGVRDSKQHGRGLVPQFTAPAWKAFATKIREGETSL